MRCASACPHPLHADITAPPAAPSTYRGAGVLTNLWSLPVVTVGMRHGRGLQTAGGCPPLPRPIPWTAGAQEMSASGPPLPAVAALGGLRRSVTRRHVHGTRMDPVPHGMSGGALQASSAEGRGLGMAGEGRVGTGSGADERAQAVGLVAGQEENLLGCMMRAVLGLRLGLVWKGSQQRVEQGVEGPPTGQQ